MTQIVLTPVTTGYNISNINANFTNLQNSINTDVLHAQGGNNVLKQDLDFNGYRALNLTLGGLNPPVANNDAVRLIDLNNEAIVRAATDNNLQTQLNTLKANQGSGIIGYATLAALNADLSKPDGTVASVTNDPTVNNNTTYRKSGPAGSGSWVVSVDRITNFTNNLASASGAAQVGFLQAGTGAIARSVQDKVREIVVAVEDFGAVGDGFTDDTLAIQRAVDYVQALPRGGVVKFGRNKNYKITNTITNDRLNNPETRNRVSFVGEDEITTVISSTVGTAFSIRNTVSGGTGQLGESSTSNQTVSNMTIYGPSKAAGSVALLLELAANIHVENVRIQNFDFAIYAQDVDQAYFKRCELRFNNKGIFARKNPSPNAVSTQPNNWVLIQCGIGSNVDYGCQWTGGSTISFFGGIIASNGFGNPAGQVGFGAAFTDCGYEGGVGPNFYGTYFEDNNGLSDVIVQSTSTQSTPITQCVYNFFGCSFNRINGNTSYAVNSIRAVFGPVASVGQQVVNVNGCSFKSLGAYVPNASRPYIAYTSLPADNNNFFSSASLYEDAIETPSFVYQGNQPGITCGKALSTSVPASTDTVIAPDNGIQQNTWFGPFASNGITIPQDGWYTFNAQQVFNTNTNGYKRIQVLRNGTVLASGSVNSVDNIVSCSGLYYFTAGQIITVVVRQETGGTMNVSGSNTAVSTLSLKRMA